MKAPFVKGVIPVLLLLLSTAGGRPATEGPKDTQGSLEGIVLPDNVHDHQPFSFAAPQVAEGQVVSIKTLDGVVVDHRSADKYGRIFLAAGLSAGTYLISRGDGRDAKPDGQIDVRPAPSDAAERSWVHPSPQVRIVNPPQAAHLGDPLWLSGHGFSPNAADMQANLYGAGQTHSVPILAATEDQIKLAPIEQVKPGAAELKIINQATQQSAPSLSLFFYDLQAHLEQSKLKRGQQTTMVLEALPADVKMKVHATISGQATFGGGQAAMDGVIDHGRLTVPVDADRGAGNFHIEYEGEPQDLPQRASCGCGCGGTAQPACAHKGCSCASMSTAGKLPPQYAGCSCGCGGTAQPACAHKNCACANALARAEELKRKQAACSCGCGGTAQPACAHKNCSCANSVAEDLRRKQAACSCGCGGTAQPACAHKNCACANAADAGLPVTLQPRLENVSEPAEKTTGRGGCSCGCGGTAQPRCAHKACGCAG